MERNFDEWLNNFKTGISTYNWYTDFDKIYKNVDNIKVELNILNSLIGSRNIKNDFIKLLNDYPNILKAIPILIAVRKYKIFITTGEKEFNYNFKKLNYSLEQYCEFMDKTGLFDLISNHLISNLVDYVTGVETGLDTNARKNRTGDAMEDIVENFIINAGFIKGETYFKEMYIEDITRKWGINLSAISFNGKTEKRFDFVVKTNNMIYGVEANFYSNGGSKLNETARSYKTITLESKSINGFTFVWFTDGKGWKKAKNNLHETYDVLEHIYNIDDMEKGIIEKVFV